MNSICDIRIGSKSFEFREKRIVFNDFETPPSQNSAGPFDREQSSDQQDKLAGDDLTDSIERTYSIRHTRAALAALSKRVGREISDLDQMTTAELVAQLRPLSDPTAWEGLRQDPVKYYATMLLFEDALKTTGDYRGSSLRDDSETQTFDAVEGDNLHRALKAFQERRSADDPATADGRPISVDGIPGPQSAELLIDAVKVVDKLKNKIAGLDGQISQLEPTTPIGKIVPQYLQEIAEGDYNFRGLNVSVFSYEHKYPDDADYPFPQENVTVTNPEQESRAAFAGFVPYVYVSRYEVAAPTNIREVFSILGLDGKTEIDFGSEERDAGVVQALEADAQQRREKLDRLRVQRDELRTELAKFVA